MFEFNFAPRQAFDPLGVAQVAETIKLGQLRQQAMADQKAENDALKVYGPRVLAGDRGAVAELAATNPKAAFSLNEQISKLDERQRAQLKQRNEDFARVAAWADTSEKWDQGVDLLAPQYPDIAKYRGQFSPARREFVLSQARSINDILDQTKPQVVGNNLVRVKDGKVETLYEGGGPPTELARLIRERDAFPPGDPRRATYAAAIGKATTREGDTGGAFRGSGMDQQAANFVLEGNRTGNTNTREYAVAYDQLYGDKHYPQADGSIVIVRRPAPPGVAPPGSGTAPPATRTVVPPPTQAVSAPAAAPPAVASTAPAPHPDTGRPMLRNPDGSVSTERSITITDPRVNGGKPTNIPTIWDGQQLSDEAAIARAAGSGQSFQSFGTIPEAVAAAKARSDALGRALPQAAGPAVPTASAPPSIGTTTPLPNGGSVTVVPAAGARPADAAHYRKLVADGESIKSVVNDYVASFKKASVGERAASLAGASTPLNTAYNVQALMAKGQALFELGVLNGPDLKILQRILPDPSTFRGAAVTESWLEASADKIKSLIDTRVREWAKANGIGGQTFPGSAPGERPPASAESMRARYGLD